MDKALLRGRQIFKFGLLRKKDNKKNLKIRLVSNRMVVAFFRPTILIQKRNIGDALEIEKGVNDYDLPFQLLQIFLSQRLDHDVILKTKM